jgi:hypothetical protein
MLTLGENDPAQSRASDRRVLGVARNQMFRASPWVSYDPSADYRNQGQPPPPALAPPAQMDEDIDMDAPQISTLREDDSPSPVTSHPARTSKFRVKLLLNEGKSSALQSSSGPPKQAPGLMDDEDDEEEEDQLIDDEEDARSNAPASGPSSGSRQPDTPPKRKVNPKKRVRKTESKLDEEKRKTSFGE